MKKCFHKTAVVGKSKLYLQSGSVESNRQILQHSVSVSVHMGTSVGM